MRAKALPAFDEKRKAYLLSRIDRDGDTDCWNWTGGQFQDGYGVASIWPHGQAKAHRAVFQMLVRELDVELTLDHLCRNKLCVNPDHLEEVTADENNRRSNSWAGINSRKTHCKHGHEFNAENTGTDADGFRRCITCLCARRNKERRLAA